MGINQWNQPPEVLRRAMGIQCGAIGPFLNEYKMARVLLIDKKVVGDAQRLPAGELHQFPVKRHDKIDTGWLDEILSDDFEHFWPANLGDLRPAWVRVDVMGMQISGMSGAKGHGHG